MPHAVVFQADYKEKQSRLTTFFRLIVAIPWYLMAIIWGLLATIGVVIAWFALLITGRYPDFAYDWVSKYLRFNNRVSGWLYLLTDEWPSFGGDAEPQYPIRLIVPEPLEQYNRVKVLFRIILMIPVYIMVYIFSLLAQLIGIVLWFAIVITGKAPRGLWDIQKMAISYMSRGYAYMLLVTESYPAISEDGGDTLPPSPAEPAPSSPFGG